MSKITIKTFLNAERAANIFRLLVKDRYYREIYDKLSSNERGTCLKFVIEHSHETKEKYLAAVDGWNVKHPQKYGFMRLLVLVVNGKRRAR